MQAREENVMRKSLLVLGLVWASVMTMAQTNNQQKKDAKPNPPSARETGSGMATGKQSVTTARETGSGMATGKMASDQNSGLPQKNVIHRDLAARETGSGMATGKVADGKTTGADDWEAKHKNNMSSAQSNPMYEEKGGKGDNPLYQGDNKSGTNPLYESNSLRATKTRSNIQNNRVAAGDVNGDGTPDVAVSADQQDTARITKSRSNIQNNRVATGDVNGDGVAEVVVKSKSNITNNRGGADASTQNRAAEGSNDKQAPRDAASGQASGKPR